MRRPVMATIAILLMIGFFAVLGTLLYGAFLKVALDGTLKDVLLVMLGTLGTMVATVVNFYFGSSQGSMAKDALLARGNNVQPNA